MSLQVVEPRMRGFISLTAHPDGCAAGGGAPARVRHADLHGVRETDEDGDAPDP